MKCPEVMPNVDNLSLRRLHKTHLIQTATLRFSLVLYFSIPLEEVYDQFYALEVSRKSERWNAVA